MRLNSPKEEPLLLVISIILNSFYLSNFEQIELCIFLNLKYSFMILVW